MPDEPAPPPSGLSERIRQRWRKFLAGIGGIAALVLVTGQDLYEKRQPDDLPDFTLGEQVALGPYKISIQGAELHPDLPDGSTTPQGPFLWVRARAENLTSSTRGDLGDYLRAGGKDAAKVGLVGPVGLYLARDKAPLMQLQPALPENVILAAAAPPADLLAQGVRVTLFSATWKDRDALSGAAGWYAIKPKATIRLYPKGLTP